MLEELHQVLRLVMTLVKQRQKQGVKTTGGLLVLLWTETGTGFSNLNCAVAAAGPWCRGLKQEDLRAVFTDLKGTLFACTAPCSEPDPEELWAFTELHGPFRILYSFQIKDVKSLSPDWQTRLKALLQTFSLANAGIQMHLIFRYSQQTLQQVFSVKFKSKVTQADQPPLILDVTCQTQLPEGVKKECWCLGGHPVLGSRLPLLSPPHVIDQGLYGELSVQLVSLLRPCMLQYPNLATQLNQIQVLVYSPSNVPITGPSTFFQTLPAHLDSHELGFHGLHCTSLKDITCGSRIEYQIQHDNNEETDQVVQQSLLLLFFLQHHDPFISQVCDLMVAETLIKHHLEDILSNNRQAVTTSVQTELKNILKAQNRRKKVQEKLHSAVKVIISSSINIVSSSSNIDFRNACLTSMEVHDTHELSVSLFDSLRRVTSWKFKSENRCFSARTTETAESDEHTRIEI